MAPYYLQWKLCLKKPWRQLTYFLNQFCKCSVQVFLDPFDKRVALIMFYIKKKVWRTLLLSKNLSVYETLYNTHLKTPVVRLQKTFVNKGLGIHSKSFNWKVRSKAGRKPALSRVLRIISIIKFWNHLVLNLNPIIQAAIKTSKSLFEMSRKSLSTSFHRILELWRLVMDYKTGHRGYSIPMVASSVNKSIHNTWAVERNSNATVKLFLYCCIKKGISFQGYLHITNFKT